MAEHFLFRAGSARLAGKVSEIFRPNGSVSRISELLVYVAWVIVAVVLWMTIKIPFVPQLQDVLATFPDLWARQGLAYYALLSTRLNVEALVISTVLSLGICYLYPLSAARPVIAFVAKLRFLGLSSLFVFLIMLLGANHKTKLIMLVFWETVFFVTSMRDVVHSIPKERYDHARTQGMSEWRAIYDVVVLGTFDQALDIMRSVAAIGWGMVPMVESVVQSEGGLGIMLLRQNKHFKLEELVAISIVIVVIGILTDSAIKLLKRLVCRHAELRLERR